MDSMFTDKEKGDEPQERLALTQLRQAWTNEKRSPELLRYEGACVDEISGLIRTKTTQLDNVPQDLKDIYQLDIDRAQYILKAYLRSRLFKIQKHGNFYLKNEPEKLSRAERRFAEKLKDLHSSHFQASFLHCLPVEEAFQSTTTDAMLRAPDLTAFVFVRALVEVGRISCSSGAETYNIELNRDKSYLVKYNDVRSLVEQGKVCLI